MPIGPGKYDDLCTEVREKAKAQGAIVIIIDGNRGFGFSCQFEDPVLVLKLPVLLEDIAKELRRSSGI